MQLRTSTPDSKIKLVLYLQTLGVGMGRGVKQVIFLFVSIDPSSPSAFLNPTAPRSKTKRAEIKGHSLRVQDVALSHF